MAAQWLTGLIREVHIASRGTYGSRRVHAELTMALGVCVSKHLVAILMHNAGIYGLPGPARIKRLRGIATAGDLVNRKFHRLSPNELWVTDITSGLPPASHSRRQGLLLRSARHIQSKNCWLVHRHRAERESRSERVRHGDQKP